MEFTAYHFIEFKGTVIGRPANAHKIFVKDNGKWILNPSHLIFEKFASNSTFKVAEGISPGVYTFNDVELIVGGEPFYKLIDHSIAKVKRVNNDFQMYGLSKFLHQKSISGAATFIYNFLVKQCYQKQNYSLSTAVNIVALSTGYTVNKTEMVLDELNILGLFDAYCIDDNKLNITLKNLERV